jgi:ABC-type transport system involved in multi-copper enzyme maturation permease subunit
MKYWAILKDSFYETIDFKTFYVLLGISSLIMLFCFGIQFPYVGVKDALVKNLDTYAGSDLAQLQAIRRASGGPKVRPADAAMTVANIAPVPGDAQRFRFELRPKSEPPHVSDMDDGEKSTEHANKLVGQAMQLTIDQRQAFRKAMRGDASWTTLFKLFSPPQTPSTTEAWNRVIADYLNSFEGIRDAKTITIEGDPKSTPTQIVAEVTIDDSKLPYRQQIGLFFGLWKIDLSKVGTAVSIIQSVLVDAVAGWVGLIVALVVTAGFVPSMLQKGTLDFLLVKPIHRPTLLLWKYIGGLLFVFVNGAFLVGGTWLAFGVNTGNWSPWYLLSVVILVAFFAILYSLTLLVGVWSRSALAAILVTLGFWFVMFLVQVFYSLTTTVDEMKPEWVKNFPPVLTAAIDWVHCLLPKPEELAELNQMILAEANQASDFAALQRAGSTRAHINWTETISTSAAFIVLMLGLASWRFAKKDY